MLGTVTVKAENTQVNSNCKIRYHRYRVLPITQKLASYRGEQEHTVPGVPKRVRFAKALQEGG